MKQSIFFRVGCAGEAVIKTDPLLDTKLFEEIKLLADTERFNVNKLRVPIVAIRGPVDHPAIIKIMELLANVGWHPSHKYFKSGEMAPAKRFRATISNQYSAKELDQFQWFSVVNWGAHWITGTADPELMGDCLVGAVDDVGEDSGEKWKQKIGIISNNNYFVSDGIKGILHEEGVIGIGYRELLWDDPTKAKGAYWQIAPTIRMPASETPLVDHEDRLEFDDGPFEDCELRYLSRDIGAMGEFDVAWTQEEIPIFKSPISGKHSLIVSRKFRHLCIKLKLEVTFAPVRIDSPPPRLPAYFPEVE